MLAPSLSDSQWASALSGAMFLGAVAAGLLARRIGGVPPRVVLVGVVLASAWWLAAPIVIGAAADAYYYGGGEFSWPWISAVAVLCGGVVGIGLGVRRSRPRPRSVWQWMLYSMFLGLGGASLQWPLVRVGLGGIGTTIVMGLLISVAAGFFTQVAANELRTRVQGSGGALAAFVVFGTNLHSADLAGRFFLILVVTTFGCWLVAMFTAVVVWLVRDEKGWVSSEECLPEARARSS